MKRKLSLVALATLVALTGCNDDGDNGSNGLNSLVTQTDLATGNSQCWLGGVQIDSGVDANGNGTLEAGEIAKTSYVCNPDNFSSSGVELPYSVMRNDLPNAAIPGSTMEIRNGGYGSDMDADPSNPMRFYGLTDRGPNASYTGSLGAGKKFPTPDYIPRIGLFEIQATGSVRQVSTILLKDRDGNPISGLPNSAALGGTNEIPYDADGNPILVDSTQPYDATTNPTKTDDYGLDSEGLVAMKDGTFWVSDEYGPHMVHFDATGKEIGRINPFAADSRDNFNLPGEFAHRWANRGMEGLTVTPDQKTLVGIMQSSLDNPGKNRTDLTRIVTVNLETGAISQYLYRQEKLQNANCAIKALSATRFLVIERDGAFYNTNPNAMKRVYEIDISAATDLEKVAAATNMVQDPSVGLTIDGRTLEQVVNDNLAGGDSSAGWDLLANDGIVPVTKKMVVDMVAEVGYPHDKMEGLWIINNSRIGVLNDDDFAVWSTDDGELEQKYLDDAKSRIDANTLYIVKDLDLGIE
ncbi:MAG: esterase-like activity of phytase family protein [Pseudomonadota bacterium]|uniref:esterase-like activity of phytase family protein n=1 Tax=Gallaecimonas pentaromativorans TaxID=584787 RepID=UPI00067F64CD|nr:esterase-like activity of phytase family protein [Gallaecimonas pentaromativorans]MED5525415.1 esterase-like activity of phytase family protein [Pseudomonadota bacterium]